jgi:DNA-binding transcriptional MerR regulator
MPSNATNPQWFITSLQKWITVRGTGRRWAVAETFSVVGVSTEELKKRLAETSDPRYAAEIQRRERQQRAQIIEELAELKDELYRSGWGDDVNPHTAHVRDVLDKLIQVLETHFANEVRR